MTPPSVSSDIKIQAALRGPQNLSLSLICILSLGVPRTSSPGVLLNSLHTCMCTHICTHTHSYTHAHPHPAGSIHHCCGVNISLSLSSSCWWVSSLLTNPRLLTQGPRTLLSGAHIQKPQTSLTGGPSQGSKSKCISQQNTEGQVTCKEEIYLTGLKAKSPRLGGSIHWVL
jgi:hypothetical protein